MNNRKKSTHSVLKSNHPLPQREGGERVFCTLPRGIRNNNPLNIRLGNNWKGEAEKPTDTHFEQFQTMEYGIRAAFILLRRYIKHYGRDTIAKIITSWAPPQENNTQVYIAAVATISGIDSDQCLHFEDRAQMLRLADAMIFVENGLHVTMDTIGRGYDMAQ